MHLKGRSLDRLLMFRPFASLPLCPRGNFIPPQMQTASPWKLLWKLPRQQNAHAGPRLFKFFWDVFLFWFSWFLKNAGTVSSPRGLREKYLSLVLWIGTMTWRENDERAQIYKQKAADCGRLLGLRSSTVTQQFVCPVYPRQMCRTGKKNNRFFPCKFQNLRVKKPLKPREFRLCPGVQLGSDLLSAETTMPPFARRTGWTPPTFYFWLSAAVSTGKRTFWILPEPEKWRFTD